MVARRSAGLRTGLLPAAMTAVVGLLASCSLFGAHPFPDYLSGVEKEINISSRIQAALKTAVSARYEIADVTTNVGERVLVLVDPVVSEPSETSPTPELLIFDRNLNYIGAVAPASPLDYVGRPYTLAADGNILSGDTIFDPLTGKIVFSLGPTGLAGFGFTANLAGAPTTCIVSLPAGESSSVRLVVKTFNDMWILPGEEHSLDIVADPQAAQTSYLLEGARLESDGDTLTLMIRDLETDSLSVVRTSLAAIASGTASPLLGAPAVSTIDGKNATVYFTGQDIVVRRGTGRFERYSADGSSLSSSITADRRDGIVYGFSPGGAYLYRLDPATGAFLLIRSWW